MLNRSVSLYVAWTLEMISSRTAARASCSQMSVMTQCGYGWAALYAAASASRDSVPVTLGRMMSTAWPAVLAFLGTGSESVESCVSFN